MHFTKALIRLVSGVLLLFGVTSAFADPLFVIGNSYAVGDQARDVEAIDFDCDSDLDLAVTAAGSDCLRLLHNNGDGSFSVGACVSVGDYPVSVFGADFDNDGDHDLAVINSYSDNMMILLNGGGAGGCGGGNFVVTQTLEDICEDQPQAGISPVNGADVDGDGDCDLVVAMHSMASFRVFLNNGDGSFTRGYSNGTLDGPIGVYINDLNGDDILDLAFGIQRNSGYTSIVSGIGDGTFTHPPVNYAARWEVMGIAGGDVDDDGDVDFVTSSLPHSVISVFKNNGSGVFSRDDWPAGFTNYGIVCEDFDLDGDLDVVTTVRYEDSLAIMLNNGNGAFASPVCIPTHGQPLRLCALDFDQDGDLDLAVAHQFSDDVVLFRNNTDPFLLEVSSSPELGIPIAVAPENCPGGTTTPFSCHYANGTEVTLTAPATSGEYVFQKWTKDGADWGFSTTSPALTMDANYSVVAVYVHSNCGTITDIDGNIYQTVTIGDQCWMAENLKVTHYRNGEDIPNVTDNAAWAALTTGAYCEYNNDVNNVATYGRLYNWFAAVDSRNIAPAGWHVPSDAEWQTLVDYLGGSGVAGSKLKEVGTTHWTSSNTGATNESGFTGLPGGYRYGNGTYLNLGYYAFFWSSAEYYGTYAWFRALGSPYSDVFRDYYDMRLGMSVRCVRNTPAYDSDGDGIPDEADNCPDAYNPQQWDTDADGIGDSCDVCTDPDSDSYGLPQFPASTCQIDNCPGMANSDQVDVDGNGIGDLCTNNDPEGTVQITPINPTENDTVIVTISGSYGNSCYQPGVIEESGDGHPFRYTITTNRTASPGCFYILIPFSRVDTIGLLEPGVYGVQWYEYIHDFRDTTVVSQFASRSFTVTPLQRTLSVASSPASGVSITVSPSNCTGGTTPFSCNYANGTAVTLTAPATAAGNAFQKWQKNGADWGFSTTSPTLTMDANYSVTAVYVTTQPPHVIAQTPAPNEFNVAPSTSITATFDMDMNPATLNATTVKAIGAVAGPVQGIVTYDNGSRTVTFDPSSNLPAGETVTTLLTTSIQSSTGIPLSQAYSWSFTTATVATTGYFGAAMGVSSGTDYVDLAVADFNGDGYPDIVQMGSTNNISVMLNNTTGTDATSGFGQYVLYPVTSGQYSVSVATGDFDGDHDVDIAVLRNDDSDYHISIMRNNDNGTFSVQPNVLVGNGLGRDSRSADFNGDGCVDLAFGLRSHDLLPYPHDHGVFVILLGKVDGTFQGSGSYVVHNWSDITQVQAADLNQDGHVDVVAQWGNVDEVAVFLNNGSGSMVFDSDAANSQAKGSNHLAIADLDGDSYLDIVTAFNGCRYTCPDVMSFFKNTGAGRFVLTHVDGAGFYWNSMASGDIDGDRDNDLVVIEGGTWYSPGGWIDSYRNFGGFDFRNLGGDVGMNNSPCYGTLVDLDNDGDLDVVVGACMAGRSYLYVSKNRDCYDSDGDTYGDPGHPENLCMVDNCPTVYNPTQNLSACTFTAYTAAGPDSETDLGDVTIVFDNVTTGGTTELIIAGTGPATGPDGFDIVPWSVPTYYNVSTSASYQGSIELCVGYGDSLFSPELESLLKLLHHDGTSWQNITTTVDTEANTVCGVTTSLSPFALAIPNAIVCGDANGDDFADISDVVYLIAYIFSGGAAPDPLDAGDANCDGFADISDVVYLIAYIFSGGQAPCALCK